MESEVKKIQNVSTYLSYMQPVD